MSDDFSWSSANVVVREQLSTAVYINSNGDVVIRQQHHDGVGDDPFIVVNPIFLQDLLLKLRLVAEECGVEA